MKPLFRRACHASLRRLPPGAVLVVVWAMAGCALPVKTKEADAPVVNEGLEPGIVNSDEPSEEVREFVRQEGLGNFFQKRPTTTIATLEKRLADNPSDSTVRLSICELAVKQARKTEKKDISAAVGLYLTALEHAAFADDETFRALTSATASRAVELLHDTRHDWRTPTVIPGALREYTLTLDTASPRTVDPAAYSALKSADTLDLSGFRNRVRTPGIGAPMIGTVPGENRWLVGDTRPSTGEFDLPLNALFSFREEGRVSLALFDLTRTDHAATESRTLAADMSAPLAELLSQGPGPFSGIASTIRPNRFNDLAGLYFLEPYRPEKIPVVFVHGLLGEPLTWRDTCNELLGDPEIRTHYQFWLYRYPTGSPLLENAAAMRRTLIDAHDHFAPKAVNGRMDRMVMIGYSLGGLMTSLQIREGGDSVWSIFCDTPLDSLGLGDDDCAPLRERIYFKPLPFIRRVLFIATPHRGSPLAEKPAGRLLSALISMPADVFETGSGFLGRRPSGANAVLASILDKSRVNGIDELSQGTETLKIYSGLPIEPRVVTHSIIGDEGLGNSPNSSDGWVPYASSHLEEAVSEKIVPTNHRGTHGDPATVVEIARILRIHLRGGR